MTTRAQELDRE